MSLVREVDALYEQAANDPANLTDQALSDWVEATAGSYPMDKATVKYLRRCMTAARKVAAFWEAKDGSPKDGWRSGVDMALGVRAWRPQLDLAMHLLGSSSDPELFDHAVTLFRAVHNQPYLDGITYEEWMESRTIGEQE